VLRTGEIFVNKAGYPWRVVSLTPRMKILLPRAAQELKIPAIGCHKAPDLRKTFATTAARQGLPDAALRSYPGHAALAGDMLNAHYRRVSQEELRMVADRMQAQWEKKAWQEPINLPVGLAVNASEQSL